MATKHILDLLTAVASGTPLSEEAQEVARRALEELAAIHLLAKRLDDAGFTGQLRSERRHQSADLLESIAKDAP